MCKSDDACVHQCINGRPDAYRVLVERYERPILTYLVGRLGDREAAAEVAQESFVRAYFRLSTLKEGNSFFAWLMGISQRVMLETFRRNRRTQQLSPQVDPVDPSANEVEGDTELAEAVARLPDIYREVTVLRYFGGLTCAEVGDRLGVPLGTVTKRLSRAYGLLRQSLTTAGNQRSEVQR
jgi:RNA polymerase sigma-70 factor, ECF subfamily